jgi:hypothetical protein
MGGKSSLASTAAGQRATRRAHRVSAAGVTHGASCAALAHDVPATTRSTAASARAAPPPPGLDAVVAHCTHMPPPPTHTHTQTLTGHAQHARVEVERGGGVFDAQHGLLEDEVFCCRVRAGAHTRRGLQLLTAGHEGAAAGGASRWAVCGRRHARQAGRAMRAACGGWRRRLVARGACGRSVGPGGWWWQGWRGSRLTGAWHRSTHASDTRTHAPSQAGWCGRVTSAACMDVCNTPPMVRQGPMRAVTRGGFMDCPVQTTEKLVTP